MPQEQLMIEPPQHYPEIVAARQAHTTPESLTTPDSLLPTPEGYLTTEQESRDLQQALALDFDIMAGQMTLSELQLRAKPAIDALNQKRPNEPIDPNTASRPFLQHIIRPVWHEYFPSDDSAESQDSWQNFVEQWPEHIQDNLEELQVNDGALRKLAANHEVMEQVAGMRTEKIEVMRAASSYLGAERTISRLSKQAVAVRSQAALSNRGMTSRERKKLEHIASHQELVRKQQGESLSSQEIIDEVQERRAIRDVHDLKRGLLLTDRMQANVDYILPSLVSGAPVLLVGETGGAKTALAEFVSKEYMGAEPEFISGHAEVNTYQLAGKMTLAADGGELSGDAINTIMDQLVAAGGEDFGQLTPELRTQLRITAMWLLANKATVSDFMPGPMLRAMEEGKPIILDEINAMPSGFLKRLNKVLQLRPGDPYTPQEDSGRSINVKPGFCIIATANEKSKRYKGVDDLSVEFQNRFGANIVRIGYPDATVPDGQPPKDNLRLALAFLRDRSGHMDPDINLKELGDFVRAAHVTQKMFTGSDVANYVDSSVVRDGVKEAVIAPRTMIDILAKIKEGQDFNTVLSHFVSGLKNVSDRAAIKAVLEASYFEIKG